MIATEPRHERSVHRDVKPGNIAEREIRAFVMRLDPPPEPRWSGDLAPLHAAYFDQVKP